MATALPLLLFSTREGLVLACKCGERAAHVDLPEFTSRPATPAVYMVAGTLLAELATHAAHCTRGHHAGQDAEDVRRLEAERLRPTPRPRP